MWSLVIGQGCFQVRLLGFGRLSAGKSTDCYFEARCHSSNAFVLVAVFIQLLSFLAELLPAHHMTSSASLLPSGQQLVLSGAW